MKRLKNLLELTNPFNAYLFIKILILLPFIKLLLAQKQLSEVLKRLDENRKKFRMLTHNDRFFSEKAFRYSSFILLKLLKSNNPCLHRSLILFYLFRKKGLAVKIHFGVKNYISPLKGHSWLSLNGKYFLEQSDPRALHADMYSYPDESDAIIIPRHYENDK